MNTFGKFAITIFATLGILSGALAQDTHKKPMDHHMAKPKPMVKRHPAVKSHHPMVHHPMVHHTTHRRRRHSNFKRLHSKIKTSPNGVHAPHAKPAPKKPIHRGNM